ncbi:hypothetical protein LSAT2_018603, partial [Lamellibrachia satsuma]
IHGQVTHDNVRLQPGELQPSPDAGAVASTQQVRRAVAVRVARIREAARSGTIACFYERQLAGDRDIRCGTRSGRPPDVLSSRLDAPFMSERMLPTFTAGAVSRLTELRRASRGIICESDR